MRLSSDVPERGAPKMKKGLGELTTSLLVIQQVSEFEMGHRIPVYGSSAQASKAEDQVLRSERE